MIRHYNEYQYLTGFELTQLLYKKSQEIIEQEFSAINDNNKFIQQLDLFLIHHYNNPARHCGLKWLEVNMRLPNVEDMPYNHTYWITTEEEIQNVLKYNKNDVYATEEFFKITIGNTTNPLYQGKNKIQLRKDIKAKFGINCLNFNDVKIGDVLNKVKYMENTGLTPNEIQKGGTIRTEIKFAQCILPFIKFESDELNKFLDKLKAFVLKDGVSFSEKVFYKDVIFKFGQGGLHTDDKPRKFEAIDYILEDRDCASMYPRALLNFGVYPAHLGPMWLSGYQWIYDQRIYYKGLSKDKSYSESERQAFSSIQEAFKLSLNGGG